MVRRDPHKQEPGSSPPGRHKTQAINCMACQHFFITYHPAFPYGCKAAGFKSRRLPSQEMYSNSGLLCLLFKKKNKKG